MPHMKTKSREKSHAGKPPGRGNKGRSNRCKLRVAYLSREIGVYSEQVAMEIARFTTEIGNWRTLIAALSKI